MFTSLSESLVGSVSKLAADAGAEKTFEEPCYYYRLDQAPDTSSTDLASIRSLQKEDALVVDATWKYRSEHSLPRIQQQISSGLCLGVEAPDGQVAPHTVVCLWSRHVVPVCHWLHFGLTVQSVSFFVASLSLLACTRLLRTCFLA